MPKVTKILGYNKARAWESLGFAHKKRLCQHFDTTSILIKEPNTSYSLDILCLLFFLIIAVYPFICLSLPP